jgi:hypothetical protein
MCGFSPRAGSVDEPLPDISPERCGRREFFSMSTEGKRTIGSTAEHACHLG